jgi:hypothetical protein
LSKYTGHCSRRFRSVVGIWNPVKCRLELGFLLFCRQFAVQQLAIFALPFRAPLDEQNDQYGKEDHHGDDGRDDLRIFEEVLNQIGLQSIHPDQCQFTPGLVVLRLGVPAPAPRARN